MSKIPIKESYDVVMMKPEWEGLQLQLRSANRD